MQYVIDQFKALTAIPSPSGFTRAATEYTAAEFRKLGFAPTVTNKGCVLVDLGGEGRPLTLSAHIDTLGAMVAEVKANGRLRVARIGGLVAGSVEAENCIVIPRFSEKRYEGTCQVVNASAHVNTKLPDVKRDFDTLEIVLDEKVASREDVFALGIGVGDFVCFDPRTTVTQSGYIKSRFIDDKLSVAVLLGYAKRLKESGAVLSRKVYAFITTNEEIGHGACAGIPRETEEIIAVDMGCIGEGLTCSETQVSICAQDSSGPSDYEVTSALIRCAKENGLDYAVDVYPSYGSDADAALRAGYDVRHCVIGQGVYASHGYERTHIDGVRNTMALLEAYTRQK